MNSPYSSNHECIMHYIQLFHHLASDQNEQAYTLWQRIQQKERCTTDQTLGPKQLRERLQLSTHTFLLVMAALALEMDIELRAGFHEKYDLDHPSLEYGLLLTSPLCPFTSSLLADLTKQNILCDLLLIADNESSYTLDRPLILCRTAFAWLTGPAVCADIPGCLQLPAQAKSVWFPIQQSHLAAVTNWQKHHSSSYRTSYLLGPAGSGRKSLLLRAYGTLLFGEDIWSYSDLKQQQILREMGTLSRLTNTPISIPGTTDLQSFLPVQAFFRSQNLALFVLAEQENELLLPQEVLRLPTALSAAERDLVWHTLLPDAIHTTFLHGDMTIGSVVETAQLAQELAQGNAVTQTHVEQAMMRRSSHIAYGIQYHPDVDLTDLVLPEPVIEQLRLICQAGISGGKLLQWGIPRLCEGVTAVFHGPPGTGKTTAAAAIAKQLHMPLLRVDLAQIMDKYVGETEKHLSKLLAGAKENHCVLFFDEADSLFGKRAAVSTSNDKYANLTTSFLLQEMETYHGVALLSTNLLQNFDIAFFRRLHYIVHFPMPDFAMRQALWRQALPEARRAPNLPLDLFAQVELSPACIFSVARGAAVAAMAAGRTTFDMASVTQALRLELEKQGKIIPAFLDSASHNVKIL